ncbi:hypothetical protein NKR19_g9880, partial [Coniochaeta hoffmannii]
MSSPQGGSEQGGSGSASGRRSITPAARFANLETAHRIITGSTRSGITPHEYLPDPSVHEDDDDAAGDGDHDSTGLEERQQQEQEWFDDTYLALLAGDEPPSGEEIPISAGETDCEERNTAQHAFQSPNDNSQDTVGHIFDQYAPSETHETVTSSGFNPALASVNASASNRSASIYRAAPEQIRREGASGRLGFREQRQVSDDETLSENFNVGRQGAQMRAISDNDGPSLPLPVDPPPHLAQGDNPAFPDPSVSSVTNSQALLQGGLSSPPIRRTYQPSQRANRYNIPSIPPPVPRRSSRREQPRSHTLAGDPRFAALFGTDRRPRPRYNIDDDSQWAGPGPAVIFGVMEYFPEARSRLTSNPQGSLLTVAREGVSASTSRSASAVPESSGSSSRDPFMYDGMFLAPEQERIVTSRLRTMTENATVFSQSPVNSPDRVGDVQDVPLNGTATTPSRAPAPRHRQPSLTSEGDRRLIISDARQRDRSMALGRCNCELPHYRCRLCREEDRFQDERRSQENEGRRQQDIGPYPPSPSYRMVNRGVRVAGEAAREPTFYIQNSEELYSSTERIIARPAHQAGTSPPMPTRALQRSDFTTFRPEPRVHRINGRDGNSFDVPGHGQLRHRRPTLDSYQSQPARLLGQSGSSRSRYEFRDSVYDGPEYAAQQQPSRQPRRTENWRSLTNPHNQTITSQSTEFDRRATNDDITNMERRNDTMSSAYSNDPDSPTMFGQFTFPLLPLDEARRRQAEARSRGDVDQTFLSTSTATRRNPITSSAGTTNTTHSGRFSAFVAQAAGRAQQRAASLLPGRRRNHR